MESIKVKLSDNEEFLIQTVEIDEIGVAKPAAGRKELTIADIAKKIKGFMSFIKESGINLVNTLKTMETNEAQLKLSLGFSAEGNIVLVKTGAVANIEITLTWKNK